MYKSYYNERFWKSQCLSGSNFIQALQMNGETIYNQAPL